MRNRTWAMCLALTLTGGCPRFFEGCSNTFNTWVRVSVGKPVGAVVTKLVPFPDAYSSPWYVRNRRRYLEEVPQSAPHPKAAPRELQPSMPASPGDIQWVRAEANKAAEGFRAWLDKNKMEKPGVVLAINRPLEVGPHLLPYLKTVKRIKRGGDVVTMEEVSYQHQGQKPSQRPNNPIGTELIEQQLSMQLDRAGLQILDTPTIWAMASRRRGTPTIEDLRQYTDILVRVEAKRQAGVWNNRPIHVLNVTACIVELATGRILARTLAYVRAKSVPPSRGAAAGGGAVFDLKAVEEASLVVAHALVTQLGESWSKGIGYHLAVSELASDTQVREIRRGIERTFHARDIRESYEAKQPKGGAASFEFKCLVPPSNLRNTLQDKNLFRSFRLEVRKHRFANLAAVCVPTPSS